MWAWRERKWKTHFGARISQVWLRTWWNDGIVWITSCPCCRSCHFPLDIVLSEMGWAVTLTQVSICYLYGMCIFACGLRQRFMSQPQTWFAFWNDAMSNILSQALLFEPISSVFFKNLQFPECAMFIILEDLTSLCTSLCAKQEKGV